MFSESTILHPDLHLPSTEIDGEIVVMNCQTNAYYSLSGTAAAVWGLMKTGASLDHICESLLSEYAVDQETCRRDVSDFLEVLLRNKLIRTAEA